MNLYEYFKPLAKKCEKHTLYFDGDLLFYSTGSIVHIYVKKHSKELNTYYLCDCTVQKDGTLKFFTVVKVFTSIEDMEEHIEMLKTSSIRI